MAAHCVRSSKGAIEEAVLDLLERDLDSPALTRVKNH